MLHYRDGVYIAFGLLYLMIALRVKCPVCRFGVLKNPKAFCSPDFQYHAACVTVRYFSPWSYQVVRVLRDSQICCVRCGENYDLV